MEEEKRSYLDSKMGHEEKVFVKSYIDDQLSLDFLTSAKTKEEIQDIGDKIVSMTTKTIPQKLAELKTSPLRKVMNNG